MVRIRHFTDPGCPFAFSAERQRRVLEWRYGDGIEWETTMVVLSEAVSEYEKAGLTTEMIARGSKMLGEQYGMPIDWTERERMQATAPGCKAVIAARLHAPEKAGALLRRLRVNYFAGRGFLDEPELIARSATEAGLDADELGAWMDSEDVERATAEDKRAARNPTDAARAQDHKLGGPKDERRYTCPSIQLTGPEGQLLDVPGFQDVTVWEAAVANLDPALTRKPNAETAKEVLEWAGEPLATAEVAAVRGIELRDARAELSKIADFEAVGADGYWTLR